MSEQDEYTPSVESVQWTYASAFSCGVHTGPPLTKDWDEGKARFDRMIAQVRREAAAEQILKDAQIAFNVAGDQPINGGIGRRDWDEWRTARRIGNEIREQ